MATNEANPRIERLDAALAALEAVAMRVAAAETTRVDLQDSLAVMEDDRQRLAHELDGALARARTLEQANDAVSRRLEAASAHLAVAIDGAERT